MKLVIGMALVSLLVCTVSLSQSPTPAQRSLAYSANAAAIQEEVKKRGAKTVVGDLYDHSPDWAYVMQQIQLGSEDWLRVAVALHRGSDAGSSDMLSESIGIALIRAPENVLRLALPSFELKVVCGGRSDPLPTYVEASAEIEAQIAAVTRVKSSGLRNSRDRCLEELQRTRTNLKEFFGVK